jgi:hypothetical protein
VLYRENFVIFFVSVSGTFVGLLLNGLGDKREVICWSLLLIEMYFLEVG